MRWRKVQAMGLWAAAALGGGLAVLGAGCGLTPYNCADYSECPPEGGACPGECVPLPPLEFNGPALLWIGRESEAPACPERAPRQVYEGHGDLDTSYQCAPCACSEPACVLPSVTASDAAGCQGPTFTQLDAPAAWDGSCSSPGTATAPRSVLIDPVAVRPCAPVPPPMPRRSGRGPSAASRRQADQYRRSVHGQQRTRTRAARTRTRAARTRTRAARTRTRSA